MSLPLKLNVGCGFDKRAGYVNIDLHTFHHPDLVADIIDLHQVSDRAADEVFAQDILEHVSATKVLPALVEWNRVLVLGGSLRIRVPDLMAIAKMLVAGAPPRDILQMVYGTQSYAGDFHMAGFTTPTMVNVLSQAGFRCDSASTVDGWLLSVEATKIANVVCPAFDAAKRTGSSHVDFIRSVFQILLGREVDPEGAQHFLETLETGVRDRYQVIETIISSEEAHRKGVQLLQRDPA